MAQADPVAERALTLASSAQPGEDTNPLVSQLADGADQSSLSQARQYLVGRIQLRTDDYQATAALSLVNKALARVGWRDPYSWKHRRKP